MERLSRRTWSTPSFYHLQLEDDKQPLHRCRTSLSVTADRYATYSSYSPAVTKKLKRPDCGTASTWLRLEPTKTSTLSISEQHSSIGNNDCTRCKMCQFSRTTKMDPSKRTLHHYYINSNRKATLESLCLTSYSDLDLECHSSCF